MANGYCPALLLHMEALAGCDNAKRLQPNGFLQSVLSNMDDSIALNSGYANGHTRPTTVAFRRRPLASDTVDGFPDCNIATTSPYAEFALPQLFTKSRSFWIPSSTIRQYCSDVSEYVTIGTANTTSMNKQTQVMKEVYDVILAEVGALVTSIDAALVTQMSTQWGVNAVTGTATAVPLTFSLSTNGMQDAFVRLMSDARINEFCDADGISLVGNGPFSDLSLIKKWFTDCCSANGVNKSVLMDGFPNIFYDRNTTSIWGANHIGMFEKGSTALITAPQYVGNFAGRIATSEYFSMNVPVADYCCPQEFLDRLAIDVQIKEMDCNPMLQLDGAAAPAAVGGPGVLVMISWTGTLFVRPTNMYNTGDPLAGSNGTLHYIITATP